MLYIIIGLIVLGVISWMAEEVGGIIPLMGIIVLIIVLSVFSLWPYALRFAAICAVGYAVVKLIEKAVKYVGNQVEQHDKSQKEQAEIYQKTQTDIQKHNNDAALMEELSKNCSTLGYMNDDMWRKKLPNYVNRQYSTDFSTITGNFAKQIEQQHILQNDDWFEPFKLYVLKTPATVTKLLHEVDCAQLKMTHVTPDGDLLNTWLVKGTEKTNKDVPALFKKEFIKDMNEYLFTPSEYLKNLYGDNNGGTEKSNHYTEINYEDL